MPSRRLRDGLLVRVAAGGALLGLLLAALVVGAAGAGSGKYVIRSSDSDLWATVNVCHGKRHPPSMGVRARMPVNDPNQREFMRFYAQFKRDGSWHNLAKGGDSGWQYVGSGPFMSQEFGWTFKFDVPPPGKSFLMRGLVKFKWKLHGQVVRRAKRYTSGGKPTKHSAANCRIVGPTQTA